MEKKDSLDKKLNDKVEKVNSAIDKKIAKVSSKIKKSGIEIKKTVSKPKTAKSTTSTTKKQTSSVEAKASSAKIAQISKKVKSKNDKKKTKKKKHIFLIIFTSLAIILLSIFLIFMIYIVSTAPKFDEDELYNREATIIYDASGKEIAKIGSEKRELVSYEELPQVLVDAIIATEDSRFFQHNGFDLARFTKASVGQLSGNSAAGGASTLTMQVVKNTFTSTESHGMQGIIRKFTDIYMSVFKVEKNYTKEEIIEFYVNAPWLGSNTYGVEQACQLYFGKSVKDLNLSEAALVAGLFQAPSTYNPVNNPEAAAKRRNTVLRLMVKHGYITQEQADIANEISVESMLAPQIAESTNPYQGFIDTVVEEVMDKTGDDPYNVPMLIYSTMERENQDVINNLYAGEYYKWKNDVIQAGIAVTSVKDGSIVAVGAGRNRVGERQYNYATMAKRQPGSTAKPFFAYGPYLEYNNGNTGSIFFDEPMTYSDGTPLKNSEGGYMGMMTMKEALFRSRNIPAVQAFQQVDNEKIAEFVHNCGIDYGKDLYESASIGGFDGMTPLDMSAAYATFGRGGYYIEPYSFTKIVYRQNDRHYENKIKKKKAMSEETAYMMNYMLTYGGSNGAAGRMSVSGTDIAAKTGTSTIDANARRKHGIPDSASGDNWVAVYSPDYSISLWYGYKELSDGYTTAIEGANDRIRISVPIANRIFKENSKFSMPDSLIQSDYEIGTHPAEKPSSYTPSSLISHEYFKKDNAPTETSSRFTPLSDPTNGNATVSGNTIHLSWNGIETPNALNSSYLEDYYKKAFGNYYERYLSYFKNYNANLLGNVGYEVFLKDSGGNLSSVGFTENNAFTYNMTGQTSYSFVVKSTFSNYRSNMSSGITINVSGTPGISNSKDDDDDIDINIKGESCLPISPGASWTAESDKVTVNGTVISSANIVYSYSSGTSIPLDSEGEFVITYKITYKGQVHTTRRTVSVKAVCS